jgi:SAM-dependent methyltransferase
MVKKTLRHIKSKTLDVLLQSNLLYKSYLLKSFPPKFDAQSFQFYSGSRVLKDNEEIESASKIIEELGLPSRSDPSKNWDTLIALNDILQTTDRDSTILDAGAEKYSAILPWLYLYGYKNLIGNNLVFKKSVNRGPIRYEFGDITNTNYSDNYFDAITCLSVIEHGVDASNYFKEMYRILKPGKLLITSTDYFEPKIEVGNKTAYGGSILIHSKDEIQTLLEIAKNVGFILTTDIQFECDRKPVKWQRYNLAYTYIVFTLKKNQL